jgi:undecaprenyl-diphosphatase
VLTRAKPSRRDRALSLLPGRRIARRNPVLAALGDADQALLRFLRTRGHAEPVETAMQTLGMAGEYAAVWVGIGAVGASVDERRRGQWLAAGLVGPLAVGVNYIAKLSVGRQRPLIEDHPALAKAPTKLSFPSAHATSSVAAATALGRVQPRARPYLFALAATICVGRPYLGMHYPSDVLGGAVLGFCLGSLVPGLGAPPTEERLFDLAVDANERAQASRRATGNGGATAPVPSVAHPAEPGSAEADTGGPAAQ